jgi:membrane-associated phospholipid phosphatase
MIVAGAVVGVGLAAGAAASWFGWRRSRPGPDPTDPHVSRRTVWNWLRRHPRTASGLHEHHPDPRAAAAGLLTATGVVLAAGAAAAGVVLVMVRTRTGLARADRPLAEWAAEHATDASTEVVRSISEFGGTTFVVAGAMAVTAFELVRDRRAAIPLYVAVTVAGQFALSNAIKVIVDRARPDLSPLTGFSGTSFPSGHATAAAATWACVAFLVGRRRHRHVRALLVGAAVALAVAVAATRVALGVHWTTDVIAGLLVGWAWWLLVTTAFGGRVLHFGEPVAVAEHVSDVAPTSEITADLDASSRSRG